jgi:outer membrane murein-binding lipoprotein Lpp
MRTNGGCSCLKDLDFDKRMRTQGYIRHLEAEVERLWANTLESQRERAERAEAEVERLRAYVGSEMARSDFRTAADMRAEVERLRGDIDKVLAQRKAGTLELLAENERHAATTARVRTLESEVEQLREKIKAAGWCQECGIGQGEP